MKQTRNKSEKYFVVSRAILEIIEKEGPAKVSHSEVARLSKVSRAWIYEYMGKNREDLIDTASELFASYFTRSNVDVEGNTAKAIKTHLENSQEIALQKIIDTPVIIKLYFRFRGTATPMGVAIKKYEKHWLDFMAANFIRIMGLDENKAVSVCRAILTLRLGYFHRVATSPNSAKETLEAKEGLNLLYSHVCGEN